MIVWRCFHRCARSTPFTNVALGLGPLLVPHHRTSCRLARRRAEHCAPALIRFSSRASQQGSWAISRTTARTPGKACAAGFRDKRTQLPLQKRWTFETDLTPLRKVLEKLRPCPGCPLQVRCMKFDDSDDAVSNMKSTARYPPMLARMLALAVSAQPAKQTRTAVRAQ